MVLTDVKYTTLVIVLAKAFYYTKVTRLLNIKLNDLAILKHTIPPIHHLLPRGVKISFNSGHSIVTP
jgi:hypothetical protein